MFGRYQAGKAFERKIEQACRFVDRGSSEGNEATKYVAEYFEMLRLKEMGIVTNSYEIDELTREIFLYISETFDRIQRLKRKK